MVGEFNEILFQFENVGGRERPESQMKMFKNALEENDLFYLSYVGDMYTWSNKHVDASFTKERLDRAVANNSWK